MKAAIQKREEKNRRIARFEVNADWDPLRLFTSCERKQAIEKFCHRSRVKTPDTRGRTTYKRGGVREKQRPGSRSSHRSVILLLVLVGLIAVPF